MKPTDKRLIFPLPDDPEQIKWETILPAKNTGRPGDEPARPVVVSFTKSKANTMYLSITISRRVLEKLGWTDDTRVKVSKSVKAGMLKLEPDATEAARRLYKIGTSKSRMIKLAHQKGGEPLPPRVVTVTTNNDILLLSGVAFPYIIGEEIHYG